MLAMSKHFDGQSGMRNRQLSLCNMKVRDNSKTLKAVVYVESGRIGAKRLPDHETSTDLIHFQRGGYGSIQAQALKEMEW